MPLVVGLSFVQFTLPYVVDVCLQLTCGLRHLHACGVLHRDLKTDNALVQAVAPLIVKWADFGCSVKLIASTTSDATYGMGESCGQVARVVQATGPSASFAGCLGKGLLLGAGRVTGTGRTIRFAVKAVWLGIGIVVRLAVLAAMPPPPTPCLLHL